MRVLLISANTEQINVLPLPLGLNCVAVAARDAGHDVELLDLMFKGDVSSSIERAVQSFHPEVIGVSVRNIDDQCMEDTRFLLEGVGKVVSVCRGLTDAPIVLGGAGFSIFPESALNYLDADMGLQGEGEKVFPMLLEKIGKGSDLSGVPGLYLKGRGLVHERVFTGDLDDLPLPDPRFSARCLSHEQEIWIPVQTHRGCPMNCSYCSTVAIEGRSIRKRSPALVVENIARHAEAGFRRFYFVDNTFNLLVPYAKALCRTVIGTGLKISWRCILYPGRIDGELVDLMAEAGCTEVSLGFESGCERILKGMNKRYSPHDIRRASEMLRDAGIGRMGFLLLGGPGETKESVGESLAFAESLELDALKITVGIRIYPGTALAETALQEGIISPDDDLLFPRFYLAKGLGGWLQETVRALTADKPGWMS